MSTERRQDLLYPPGPHPEQERDEEERRSSGPVLSLPQRLHFQLWPIRQSEAALEAALRRLSPLDRFAARLVLAQLFGGHYTGGNERAVKLCERVWGPGSVDYPIEREWKEEQTRKAERRPMPPVATLAEAQAAYHKGRVEVLRERLAAMTRDEAVPSRPEFLTLLWGMEDGVARAALAGLAGMLVSAKGRGTRDLYDALCAHYEAEVTYFATTPVGRKQLAPLPGAELLRPETKALGQVGGRAGGLLLGSWDAAASREERAQREALCQQVLAEGYPALKMLGQGGGEPLPEALRARMERLLGHDFAHVRIHTDAAAAEAARLLGARALALGAHIYFGAGQYAPGTPTGDRLLVHELVHVVQFDQGRLPAVGAVEGRVSHPEDVAEREADAAEHATAVSDAEPVGSIPGEGPLGRVPTTSTLGALAKGGSAAVWPGRATGDVRAQTAIHRHGSGSNPQGSRTTLRLGVIYQADPHLSLRRRADPASEVVDRLHFNDRVVVHNEVPGDWYLVTTMAGQSGYIPRWTVMLDPPEPEARLHLIQAGETAIGIADRYYRDSVAWGEDLRFYVNVLVHANGGDGHPEKGIFRRHSSDDWEHSEVRSGYFIWIPGLAFARSLRGQVSSGSLTYGAFQAAQSQVMAGLQKLQDLVDAVGLSLQYIPQTVQRHVEDSLLEALTALVIGMVAGAAVVAICTALGALLGAAVGGVGAAPGAAVGFKVGMLLLEWLGVAMLAVWIASELGQIGQALAGFLATVWSAGGDRQKLHLAAHQFAEAIGLFVGFVLMGLILWATSVGIQAALRMLPQTRLGQSLGETRLGQWLQRGVELLGKTPEPKNLFHLLREGLTAADIFRLAAVFGEGGLLNLTTRLTPKGMSNVFRAGGEPALAQVQRIIQMESSGRIAGLDDWVEFTLTQSNKQGPDLSRAMYELLEAERLAAARPGEVIRIGNDVAGGATRTADISLSSSGTITRNIEVTSVDRPVTQADDLSAGIRHGIDKAQSLTTPGTREVSIYAEFPPETLVGGQPNFLRRGGTQLQFRADGTYDIYTTQTPPRLLRNGDIIADVQTNLPGLANSNALTHVNIVDRSGQLVATLERVAAGQWKISFRR